MRGYKPRNKPWVGTRDITLHHQTSERHVAIMDAYAAGKSFDEIGAGIDRSRARVQQIFNKAVRRGRNYWHVWTAEEQAIGKPAYLESSQAWREAQQSMSEWRDIPVEQS